MPGRHLEVEAIHGGDLAERLDDAAQFDRVRLVLIVAHPSRVESREPGAFAAQVRAVPRR